MTKEVLDDGYVGICIKKLSGHSVPQVMTGGFEGVKNMNPDALAWSFPVYCQPLIEGKHLPGVVLLAKTAHPRNISNLSP